MSVEPEPPRSTARDTARGGSAGSGRARAPWLALFALPSAGCVLLTAGTAGLLPRLAALAAAVAVCTAAHAGLLVALAVTRHRRRSGGPRPPGSGPLGAGLLVAGAAVAAAIASQIGRAGAGDRLADPLAARLATVGLLLATLFFFAGLLVLPGPVPGPLARLHRALDAVAMAACLLYAGWLLIAHVGPTGASHPLGAGLLEASGLAAAVVAGLCATRPRAGALARAGGTALAVGGLGATVGVFAGAVPAGWLPLAALAVVLGTVLSCAGVLADATSTDATSTDARAGDAPPGRRADSGFAGYPVLAVPVATALTATGLRLAIGHAFGSVSMALGLGVLFALAVREATAVAGLRRRSRRAAAQEAWFRSLVGASADITVVLDDDLAVRWQSPAAAQRLGLRDADVLGRPFTALAHPDDAAEVGRRLAAIREPHGDDASPAPYADRPAHPALISARLRDGSGRWRPTESTASDLRAMMPGVGAVVLHVRDVGERRTLERALRRAAYSDQLTELPNRRCLLLAAAAMRAVPGRPGALLLIDLHGLRQIIDGRGREAGDAVLIEVARRLRAAVDPTDLPARLSASVFAVATAGRAVHAYALANRVRLALARPYELTGAVTVRLRVAVGLAEFAAAASLGDTLRRARLALRRAGQLRHEGVEWYDDTVEAALRRRFALEQELPGALARGELDLVFQPIVDLTGEMPAGAEALLRWRHPRRGTVVAADFVPLAEDLGLIDEIGEWVLRRACRQLAGWLAEGLDVWVSVNLAARQLAAPSLVARLRRVLDLHRLPADRLVVEVAEPELGADPGRAIGTLTGLRALGVRVALARFGSGPAPLAALRRLPVDVLKVDRMLVSGATRRQDRGPVSVAGGPAVPLLDVVVDLGRRLGLEIIAEEVEDEAYLAAARAAGCRYGQGFLLGRPQPAEHIEAYLASHRPATA